MPHSKVKSSVTGMGGVASWPLARSRPPLYSGKITWWLQAVISSALKVMTAFIPFCRTIAEGEYPLALTLMIICWTPSLIAGMPRSPTGTTSPGRTVSTLPTSATTVMLLRIMPIQQL